MNTAVRDLLIEIGTEELPPKALASLSSAFEKLFCAQLDDARLQFSACRRYATPRRLALLISGLQERQSDRQSTRYGPAVKAAFDAEGKPTKAAEGFARSCGVEVADLDREEKDGVEKLSYSLNEAGQDTAELVPELLNKALAQLPIPKRMRWGASRVEFVRPVHWVVLLFGSDVIPATVLGIQAGNATRGHRFLHNQAMPLAEASDYEGLLESQGHVIADFDKRREIVRKLVVSEGEATGGQVMMDEELLAEVTSLVEFPVALTGSFDKHFLELPPEALVLTLKSHQKCFCVSDVDDKLLPCFITVSNLRSKDPARVIEGNERVIRPRLTDAQFFFESDKQQPLESRTEALTKLIFQDKLGTVYDKSQRVAALAGWIAEQLQEDVGLVERAAQLAKCDLLTQMVGEFADLQGLMGYYYALEDGEPADVASAIYEQYLPRQAGGPLPQTRTGCILAVADKLDTMVGLFGIGQPPTGSKDPFALRRSAIGILRILVEQGLPLDMEKAIEFSIATYSDKNLDPSASASVFEFIFERFKAWYSDAGISIPVFQSVLAVRPTRPLDFDQRIQAVSDFMRLPEAEALSASNKRVSNLLDKQGDSTASKPVDEAMFSDAAEDLLYKQVTQKELELAPYFEKGDYQAALHGLASLKDPVDRFFDEVLVMADDPAVQQNRLALLSRLRKLFLHTADISFLHNS